MRRWRWWMGVGVAFLGACGPELDERADLAEDCGEPGPVQLLHLSPTESVGLSGTAARPAGDRYLVAVGEHDRPPTDDATLDDAPAHRIVSVDACGGEPQTIAEGFGAVLPPAEAGHPWAACNFGGELATIDPGGVEEPVVWSETAGCGAHVGAGGRWFLEEQASGRFDLLRLDAAGLDAIAEDIVWAQWQSDESAVLYSTADLALMELDLGTMDARAIAQGVGAFFLAGDDRFVVSKPETDPLAPGPWSVLDRQSGAEVHDLHGDLRQLADGIALDDGDRITYLELPSLARSEIPGSWGVPGITDDGALVLYADMTAIGLARPGGGAPELLYEGTVIDARLDGDDVLVWDYDYDPWVDDVILASARLLRIPIDGGPIETIVDDVHQPLGLSDGRWVSVRDQDASARGDLWVVDPEDDRAELIDRGVDLHFARISGSAHMFPNEELHPADAPFLYTIREAGERNGLWRATLAPR